MPLRNQRGLENAPTSGAIQPQSVVTRNAARMQRTPVCPYGTEVNCAKKVQDSHILCMKSNVAMP